MSSKIETWDTRDCKREMRGFLHYAMDGEAVRRFSRADGVCGGAEGEKAKATAVSSQ
jgi:hypothetical protein